MAFSGTQRTRLGAYALSRQPYGSFAGRGAAPVVVDVNPGSSGGPKRGTVTRGTYAPAPEPKKRLPKKTPTKIPEKKREEEKYEPTGNLGALTLNVESNVVQLIPKPEAPVAQPITRGDAERLIRDAIAGIKAEFAAQQAREDQEKILAALEKEEQEALTALELEAYLLLLLVD